MVMIGDENGDYSMSVSTKANANPNPGKTDHSVASQLLKNPSSHML
jgi:hypothetical protein